jgi:hypothetical protein
MIKEVIQKGVNEQSRANTNIDSARHKESMWEAVVQVEVRGGRYEQKVSTSVRTTATHG